MNREDIEFSRSVSLKMIVTTFSIYFFVVFTSMLVHMGASFFVAKDGIRKRMKQIEELSLKDLNNAFLMQDMKKLNDVASSILKFSEITRIILLNKNGDSVLDMNKENSYLNSDDFMYEFSYEKNKSEFWKLILFSNDTAVNEEIKFYYFFIFINSLVALVSLWVILYVTSLKILKNPLTVLLKKVQDFSSNELDYSEINIGISKDTELGVLEREFNSIKIKFSVAEKKINDLSSHLRELVIERTRVLSEPKEDDVDADIKSILVNIKQAFLIFDENLQIDSNYSRKLEEILGEVNLENRSVVEVLFKYSDISSEILETLESVVFSYFNCRYIQFDLNEYLLPKLICKKIGDKIVNIELEWIPIVKNSLIYKILVVIKDTTALRNVEDALRKRRIHIISQLLKINTLQFANFVNNFSKLFGYIKKEIAGSFQNKKFENSLTLRNIQMIKENARMIEFEYIVDAICELEEKFKNSEYFAKVNKENIFLDLRTVQNVMDEYETIYAKLYQYISNDIIADHHMISEIREKWWAANFSKINKIRTYAMKSSLLLTELARPTFENIIYTLANNLGEIAADFGRETPHVVLEGAFAHLGLNERGSDIIKNILPHLFSNAIIHGIEITEERERIGKSKKGTIHLNIASIDGGMLLKFWDDGAGLNLKKILNVAKNKHVRIPGEINDCETVANMIFLSEFSTVDSIAEVYGRGIGLSAVRGALQKNGGRINIELKGVPNSANCIQFCLLIYMPNSMFVA